jgi:hypothetical protein
MPKELERTLKAQAANLAGKGKLRGAGTTEEKKNRYVYGTMRKTGWRPKGGRGKQW